MAKAIQAFSGFSSIGSPITVAQREDGVWFFRQKIKNAVYGWLQTPWAELNEPIEHPIKLRNEVEVGCVEEYSHLTELESKQYIKWGFVVLEKLNCKLTYRLPN